MDNTLYRKRMVATDGLPKGNGKYLTLYRPPLGDKYSFEIKSCDATEIEFLSRKENGFEVYWLEPIAVKPGISLQECKDEVAKELQYTSWEDFEASIHYMKDWAIYSKYLDKVSELYASSQLSAVISENEKLKASNLRLIEQQLDVNWEVEAEAAGLSKEDQEAIKEMADKTWRAIKEDEGELANLKSENDKLRKELDVVKRFRIEDAASAISDYNFLHEQFKTLKSQADKLAEALEEADLKIGEALGELESTIFESQFSPFEDQMKSIRDNIKRHLSEYRKQKGE